MKRSSVCLAVIAIAFAAQAFAADPSPEPALWSSASKGAAAWLQTYLRQYPEGQFARQARAALDALGGSASPMAATPKAGAQALPDRLLKPGWIIEVRAMHQSGQPTGGSWINLSPWEPDPSPLAIHPMPGPRFDLGSLSRGIRGAGRLPAIGGQASWVVRQRGRWSIGARLACSKIASATFVLRVQGNRLIDRTIGAQTGPPLTTEEVASATADLEPGTYAVAWTLLPQPVGPAYGSPPGGDAEVEILVGRPGEALAAPEPGDFVYESRR